eukprot:scaffold182607_cov41-Tisochrysis_lutea.AAC.4
MIASTAKNAIVFLVTFSSHIHVLTHSLEAALASPTIPPEIVTSLLNLAEFMEHDDKQLPLDTRTLGALAEKCHAFAKALHYKVRQLCAAALMCLNAANLCACGECRQSIAMYASEPVCLLQAARSAAEVQERQYKRHCALDRAFRTDSSAEHSSCLLANYVALPGKLSRAFPGAQEMEFQASPQTAIEALIHINNQLRQPEAAVGVLTYAQ